MIVPVDGLSGSVSVLDGPGGRSTGDGVFPRGRSGWAPQAVLNVHTLEIANGSDYCSHLLGLEPACNLSTTMPGTPYDTSYPPDRMPLKELFLSFNRLMPGTRLIPGGRGYEDEVWILFGTQCDNEWNKWIVAHDEGGNQVWYVDRYVWWWGNYQDLDPQLTDYFTNPLRWQDHW